MKFQPRTTVAQIIELPDGPSPSYDAYTSEGGQYGHLGRAEAPKGQGEEGSRFTCRPHGDRTLYGPKWVLSSGCRIKRTRPIHSFIIAKILSSEK